MTSQTGIVVIGGGIVGCATAYYLARRGVAVTLVEKGVIAGEQSSRNWGFVRQQGRDPAELPLMMACNQMWEGLEQELETDLNWNQGGNLRVMTEESQLEPYRAWLEIAREHALNTQLLGREKTAQLLPGLCTPVLGGLYTEGDGQANPALVAPAFAAAAANLGARILPECAALSIETAAGKVAAVITENGEIRCDSVVCAAGAWSSRVIRSTGLRIPQLWLRASVGYTSQGKQLSPCGVWMPGVAFRQGHDGGFNIAYGGLYKHDLTLDSFRYAADFWRCFKKFRKTIQVNLDHNFLDDLTGSLNKFAHHRTLDPPPVESTLQLALSNFKTSFPEQRNIEFVKTWAGYLDATPDMLPVIDRVEKPDGLVIATGFSGHGFGLGPISGLTAAQLTLNETPEHDLRAFRCSRFCDGARVTPGNVL